MRGVQDIMGMPISVEIVGSTKEALDTVFDYFHAVDERFSTYKPDSEITKINHGIHSQTEWSDAMQEVFTLAEETHRDTHGYFSIKRPDGLIDPSGIVKGWAIKNAAQLVEMLGYQDYFLNAGGDIQSKGNDAANSAWTAGIRNPFVLDEIIKIVRPEGRGIATSGNYLRGDHIYNPHDAGNTITEIASITVIGPDVYEADRFATAAFAMGKNGIAFIEAQPALEGYQVDSSGVATMTSGFEFYAA